VGSAALLNMAVEPLAGIDNYAVRTHERHTGVLVRVNSTEHSHV